MARFTHNGVEYEELGNGKVRVIGQAAAAQPYTVTALPLTPEQQAEADRRRSDQIIQEQAARDAATQREQQRREWEATHNPDGSPKSKPQDAPAGYRFGPDGNLQFIPGGPADPALKGDAKTPKSEEDKAAVRAEAIDKIKLARNLISRSENGWFTTGFGSDAAGYFKGTPAYDLAQDTETLKNAGALTRIMEMAVQNGGKNPLSPLSNSDFQALASSLSNLDTGQSDKQYQANVQRVIDLYKRAYRAAGGTDIEGELDPSRKLPVMLPLQKPGGASGPGGGPASSGHGGGPGSVWQQPSITPGDPLIAAPKGATAQAIPIPAGMQDELDAYFAQKGRSISAEDLSQFVRGLYAKYQATPGPGLDEYAAATARALREGGPINTNIPPTTVPLTGLDKVRNDVVNTDVGAFAASMGNAGGLGIPSLLAGDQVDALRSAHPVSSTLGEIAGGITGSFITGGGLTALGKSGLLLNGATGRVLANPLTADIAYGSAYGATQSDDPLYGAAGGAVSAIVGNRIGAYAGKAGGLLGVRRVEDPLNRGERAIFDSIEDPASVESLLAQGKDLGLPMTLADADPVVAALTGSAVRKSPRVAAQARDTFARRSQGQLDRLRSGLTRDLGPLDNVPERADALIAQGRANAAPLYDQAYATPIPSSPELDSLLATPFGRQAVARARTIAANERRSPTELGFAVDADGNPILNPIPEDRIGALDAAREALRSTEGNYYGSRSMPGYNAEAGMGQVANARQTVIDAEQAVRNAPEPGTPAARPNYTTETLDYTKRGMDDILEANRNQITGKLNLDEMGRSQNEVLRALIGEMDARNPAYGAARQAYAGPAAERQALYNGRAAVTENPDLVAIQAANQTPERLAMMQLGARDRIMQGAEALSNSTNPYRILNTPAMERRLGALYPDKNNEIARLLLQRDLENQMAGTANRIVGNSATAERLSADQMFSDDSLLRPIVEGAIETAVSGAPYMTTMRRMGGQRITDALKFGAGSRAARTADEVGALALDTDTQRVIDRMAVMQAEREQHQAVIDALMQSYAQRGGHIGGGAGSAVAASLMRN